MPTEESKRGNQLGRMEKDLDEHIIQSGTTRDAFNINTGRSGGSDAGAMENLLGNAVIGTLPLTGTTIGQYADDANNKIYWFVENSSGDAIYEIDTISLGVSTVLINSFTLVGDTFLALYSHNTVITGDDTQLTFSTLPSNQEGREGESYNFTDRTFALAPGFEFVGIPTHTGDPLQGNHGTANTVVSRTFTAIIQAIVVGRAFTFADTQITCAVTAPGAVTTTTALAGATAVLATGQSDDLGTTSTAQQRMISVRVTGTVPVSAGGVTFSDAGDAFDFTDICLTNQAATDDPDPGPDPDPDVAPVVTTNAETSVGITSFTMNGSFTLGSGASADTVSSSGFYFINGSSFTAQQVINGGTRLDASDTTSPFSLGRGSTEGIVSGTQYQYVAYAVYAGAGELIGSAENVLTSTGSNPATAGFIGQPGGACEGGTAGTTVFGTFGDWGGPNVGAILPSPGAAVPTSASCDPADTTCAVSRSRTQSTPFTGGVRSQVFSCTEITPGTGTPTCTITSADNSIGGAVGTQIPIGGTETRATTCSRTDTGTDIEGPRDITNDSFSGVTMSSFEEDNLRVVACTVTQPGVPSVTIGYVDSGGTLQSASFTVIATNVAPNQIGDTVNVNVSVNVTGNVPSGFLLDSGPTFNFNITAIDCPQEGIAGPVAATSGTFAPDVFDITNGVPSSVTVVVSVNAANATWIIAGGGNNITVVARSGTGNTNVTISYNGGTMSRSGILELQNGSGTVLDTLSLSLTN